MKKCTISLIGLVLASAVATTLAYNARYKKMQRRLAQVAEEGYETAGDIIYPHKKSSKGSHLRYGPVY